MGSNGPAHARVIGPQSGRLPVNLHPLVWTSRRILGPNSPNCPGLQFPCWDGLVTVDATEALTNHRHAALRSTAAAEARRQQLTGNDRVR